jgi:hypothetical protein
MKKTFLLLFMTVCAISFTNKAVAFPVTLKVIDQTKGQITNKVNDQNEINIYTWIDNNLQAQNPRTPADWWYPMYNEPGVTPNGLLVKTADAWEWTITLQAEPGEYEWNPGAKTLGWNNRDKIDCILLPDRKYSWQSLPD